MNEIQVLMVMAAFVGVFLVVMFGLNRWRTGGDQ